MNTTLENPVERRHAAVTRAGREKLNGHRSVCLWFTGLSGSGKSTLAHAVEDRLHSMGFRTFILDGDDVRHGLDADLGFSREDRSENIRRAGEIARLFVEAGVIIMTAFISPFRADRERVRSLIGEANFVEIFVKSPIHVCEERDVKGLYKRARTGAITDFTGISSPYEEPEHPELILDTTTMPAEQCVDTIVDYLVQKKVIPDGTL